MYVFVDLHGRHPYHSPLFNSKSKFHYSGHFSILFKSIKVSEFAISVSSKVVVCIYFMLRNLEFVDDQKAHQQSRLQILCSLHQDIVNIMTHIHSIFADDGVEVKDGLFSVLKLLVALLYECRCSCFCLFFYSKCSLTLLICCYLLC